MKLGTMFGDVVRSLFRRPATQQYPAERQVTPANLRGQLIWNREKCTGCCLCIKDCPAQAIELLTVDKAAKRFVMRYHADRCAYCAQCVVSCRFKCLEMSNTQWELAALNKEPFTIYYGSETDIDLILEKFSPAKLE